MITSRNVASFQIFSMVLGLLDQQQIIWQLYLIELLALLIRMGLLKLWDLIYTSLLIWCGMLISLTNSNFMMEFQVRYLAMFCLFSVIDGFQWFWMGNLCKNNRLMLKLSKASFLVLHVSCYTVMTFLMILSVILLSMLVILNSTLNVIRHLTWQQLDLAFELESDVWDILDWGDKWLVEYNASNTQLFWLTGFVILLLLMWILMGLFFKKNQLIRWWNFLSLLNWIWVHIWSLNHIVAETASKKIEALIRSVKFLTPEVTHYPYKSTKCNCLKYCCHAEVLLLPPISI